MQPCQLRSPPGRLAPAHDAVRLAHATSTRCFATPPSARDPVRPRPMLHDVSCQVCYKLALSSMHCHAPPTAPNVSERSPRRPRLTQHFERVPNSSNSSKSCAPRAVRRRISVPTSARCAQHRNANITVGLPSDRPNVESGQIVISLRFLYTGWYHGSASCSHPSLTIRKLPRPRRFRPAQRPARGDQN